MSFSVGWVQCLRRRLFQSLSEEEYTLMPRFILGIRCGRVLRSPRSEGALSQNPSVLSPVPTSSIAYSVSEDAEPLCSISTHFLQNNKPTFSGLRLDTTCEHCLTSSLQVRCRYFSVDCSVMELSTLDAKGSVLFCISQQTYTQGLS